MRPLSSYHHYCARLWGQKHLKNATELNCIGLERNSGFFPGKSRFRTLRDQLLRRGLDRTKSEHSVPFEQKMNQPDPSFSVLLPFEDSRFTNKRKSGQLPIVEIVGKSVI